MRIYLKRVILYLACVILFVITLLQNKCFAKSSISSREIDYRWDYVSFLKLYNDSQYGFGFCDWEYGRNKQNDDAYYFYYYTLNKNSKGVKKKISTQNIFYIKNPDLNIKAAKLYDDKLYVIYEKKEDDSAVVEKYFGVYNRHGKLLKTIMVDKSGWNMPLLTDELMVKGNRVYVTYEKKLGYSVNVYSKSFDTKNFKCLKSVVVTENRAQSKIYDKVKLYNNGLYVIEANNIKRYNLQGDKLLDAYVLPKGTISRNGAVKAGFACNDKFIYYLSSNALYRCNIKKNKGFKKYMDLSNDKYITGESDVSAMGVSNENVLYLGLYNSKMSDETDEKTYKEIDKVIEYSK